MPATKAPPNRSLLEGYFEANLPNKRRPWHEPRIRDHRRWGGRRPRGFAVRADDRINLDGNAIIEVSPLNLRSEGASRRKAALLFLGVPHSYEHLRRRLQSLLWRREGNALQVARRRAALRASSARLDRQSGSVLHGHGER